MTGSTLYDYTTPNSQLVKDLKLEKHIEGGYFAETQRDEEVVSSPLAGGAPRPISTTIYYLLTTEEPRGYFHRNKSHTMHVLHQGRSRYTLIAPNHSGGPSVSYTTMGADVSVGERRQLFVGSNVWKMSRIPEEDLAFATKNGVEESVGCLITEVVSPGFVWEDHEWMTMKDLEELFEGVEGGREKMKEFVNYIRPV
ncbi:hypothetical protein FRC04_003747 [Tulasnella sp. 424]|nr:hypothetical protein FRC04_003747 [Tulasnella sp. 424]KAG8977076.1 hypothetical protein FRC05_002597 [Tulasnella sp. 425]